MEDLGIDLSLLREILILKRDEIEEHYCLI